MIKPQYFTFSNEDILTSYINNINYPDYIYKPLTYKAFIKKYYEEKYLCSKKHYDKRFPNFFVYINKRYNKYVFCIYYNGVKYSNVINKGELAFTILCSMFGKYNFNALTLFDKNGIKVCFEHYEYGSGSIYLKKN